MASEPISAEYTLYSYPFSLYSMMARHTCLLGPTTSNANPPKITLRFVDFPNEENLTEDYLTKLSPKGQVPAMTGNVLKQPLTDSLSISLHLAKAHYPNMLPADHATAITDLLYRIHAMSGLSFSNKETTPETIKYNPSKASDILKEPNISPEYRAALEYKLKFHNENNAVAFQPEVIAKAHDELRAIFSEISEHRRRSGDPDEAAWTFGNDVGPTVLDSHLLPLLLRCMDVGNIDLVPPELRVWATQKAQSEVWNKVMHGRPTVWRPSMGPAADMPEMMSW